MKLPVCWAPVNENWYVCLFWVCTKWFVHLWDTQCLNKHMCLLLHNIEACNNLTVQFRKQDACENFLCLCSCYSPHVWITSWCTLTARKGRKYRWTAPSACCASPTPTHATAVITACRNITTWKQTTSTRLRELERPATSERDLERDRDWGQPPNLKSTLTENYN